MQGLIVFRGHTGKIQRLFYQLISLVILREAKVMLSFQYQKRTLTPLRTENPRFSTPTVFSALELATLK